MASDIHKKLIVGALGCGGLLIVGFAALLYFGWQGALNDGGEQQIASPGESQEAWDSLAGLSPAALFDVPSLPTLHFPTRAAGWLFIRPPLNGDNLPVFGDTFPVGSKEQKKVVFTAQRVEVMDDHSRVPRPAGALPIAATALFRARILLAAADDWSRHGDVGEAVVALDSALTLGRGAMRSGDLERVMVGARVERDALDLLSRDTSLAGGATNAAIAAAAVEPLGRMARRLQQVDHWMMAAGASARYVDSLAGWAADSSLPMPWRTASVAAIAMGWVFNTIEPATGLLPSRAAALRRLRTNAIDSLDAELDRVASVSTEHFADRMRAAGALRGQRLLLFLP